MLKYYLDHALKYSLFWLFNRGYKCNYDSDPIEEIIEETIVFCYTADTYNSKKNSGAKYFVCLVPVEPAAGFEIYPVHKSVWLVQPTLPLLSLKFIKFPKELDNHLCFNGSKSGSFLSIRVSEDKHGPSDIVVFDYNDVEINNVIHRGKTNSRVLEDPRLFSHAGEVFSTYSVIEPYITGILTTSYLGYSPIMNSDPVIPKFGKNLMKGPEKNWGFFSSKGDIYAIYSIIPWKILIIRGDEATLVYKQTFPIEDVGPIHGGACPTFYDGKWWVFARIMSRGLERNSIVCVVFDPSTFSILGYGAPSFLSSSALSYHLFYIGSAEIEHSVWTCVGGFNDAAVAEIQFSHEDLLKEIQWLN